MTDSRAYHMPLGNPCVLCGISFIKHRVDHAFSPMPPETGETDICSRCGLPQANHRVRFRPYHGTRVPTGRRHKQTGDRHLQTDWERTELIGIDGEGTGKLNHRYIMLAAANEDSSKEWYVEAPEGGRLSTVQCLDFILSLPTRRTKIFAYSFNYDLTKMLTDVDDRTLYQLFRPNLRRRNKKEEIKGPRSIEWNGYTLNLIGTKFVVQQNKKRVVIWDIWKFFQGKFVAALRDWKVGDERLWSRMQEMKDNRAVFDEKLRTGEITEADIRKYCLEECACMGQLGRKLIEAHNQVGLKLKNYYGAGSTGGAMLTVMGIRKQILPPMKKMQHAIMSAYSGGRFENSVIGPVRESLHGWDISSAYPYHITFLPCLLHGTWKRTKKRQNLESARQAVVRYAFTRPPKKGGICDHWGPFPFRERDGTITYPVYSGGGWVWLQEYLQGEKLYPHVRMVEAWVYEAHCECQPFAKVPEYYCERCRIGKEGPGIVLKLGCNSCYGKLAQSIGNALFQSWIWAGIITSGCRAQILELLGLHSDPANMLMVATDGIYTREDIKPPAPRDTGTWEAKNSKGIACPLGGWEHKGAPDGVFFARPGIYFPMHPTKEDIKEVRGRGVGKSVVLENWQRIIDAWQRREKQAVIANVSRFCGAKTSISIAQEGLFGLAGAKYTRAAHEPEEGDDGKLRRVKPSYGEWIVRPVEMSFDPAPKREKVNKDGLTLAVRRYPKDLVSMPYNKMIVSDEAKEMIAAREEITEQPEIDLVEYGLQDEGMGVE